MKVKENIYIKVEMYMKENLKIHKLKEKELFIIILEKIKEINMLEILFNLIEKEKEYIIIKMETYMKVIGKMIKEKGEEFIIIKMEIELWEITIIISLLESTLCYI